MSPAYQKKTNEFTKVSEIGYKQQQNKRLNRRLHLKLTKRYANIKEVSEYTSIPIKTLYDWAGQGKIRSIKFGCRVLFDLRDIDKMMAGQKRTQCEKTANKIIGDIYEKNI